MALDLPTIRGNHERQLLDADRDAMGASDRHAADRLSRSQRQWLEALPMSLWLTDEVFLCHATPQSDVACYLEDIRDGELIPAALAEIEARAQAVYRAVDPVRSYPYSARLAAVGRPGHRQSRQRRDPGLRGSSSGATHLGARISACALCDRRARRAGMGRRAIRDPLRLGSRGAARAAQRRPRVESRAANRFHPPVNASVSPQGNRPPAALPDAAYRRLLPVGCETCCAFDGAASRLRSAAARGRSG